MGDYTFNTLNDKDFELLVRDLLQKELAIHLESFKSGKDQGIDLRYSSNTVGVDSIVVQAKHWSKSGFSKLLKELSQKELPKIEELKPDRYIVATSVPLSPSNKSKISWALKPYVKNDSDVYGLEDLNNLLGKFPEIENGHYKLWISSTAVMERIVHNAVKGRSDFLREQIERKARVFVPTTNFAKALEILNLRQILLIKGVPGVGKTTLAEFILYRLLDDEFELIAIEDDLRDAEEIFRPDKRQAFYFDDFLGSNYLELVSTKSSGSRISKFVDRIRNDKQKRLVLTTRTTILNKAVREFHQMGAPKLASSEYEVDIDNYTRVDKARILYNHLYFSEVDPDYFAPIFENTSYLHVIDHKNYNPRIIEFITDKYRLMNVASEKYLEFVQSNLDSPNDIWEVAYERQIDNESRFLLQCLFSVGSGVSQDVLKDAFDARIDYEVKNGGIQRSGNAFYNSVKLLLDGFIVLRRQRGSDGDYSFINPSLVDYFVGYFSRDRQEKWRVLESAVFVEQLSMRFGLDQNSPIVLSKTKERAKYLELILDRKTGLRSAKGAIVELQLVNLLLVSFDWNEIGDEIESLLATVNLDNTSYRDYYEISQTIELLGNEPLANHCLVDRWDDLILALLELADEKDQFVAIRQLFNKCSISYVDWYENESPRLLIQEALDNFWEYEVDNTIRGSDELRNVFTEEALDDVKFDLMTEMNELNEMFGANESPSFGQVEWIDFESTVIENTERVQAEDHQAEMLQDEQSLDEPDDNAVISDLFTR